MTPINPAAAGGLPQYAIQGSPPLDASFDPYEGMDPSSFIQPDAGAAASVVDPSAGLYVDPYTGQPVDPYTQPYVPSGTEVGYVPPLAGAHVQPQPVAAGAQVSNGLYTGGAQVMNAPYNGGAQTIADPYAGMAGTAPALPAIAAPSNVQLAPAASVADFAALGVFSQDEIAQLQAEGLSGEQLGALYGEVTRELQDPAVRAQLAAASAAAPAAAPGTSVANPALAASGAAAPAATGAAAPAAWNDSWRSQFRDVFRAQGLDSKTQLLLLQQFRASGVGEAELAQALHHYGATPEGAAELKAIDAQVRKSKGMEHVQVAAMSGLALAAGAGTTLLARSQGNLIKSLSRTALTGTPAQVAAATRMLSQLEAKGVRSAAHAISNLRVQNVAITAVDSAADATVRATVRSEAAAALRERAAVTNRLKHPGKKMVFNAGARHLTEGAKLSGKDLVQYALWIKQGDNAPARTAAAGGGAAADDAARATAKGLGASSAASSAVKGAGMAKYARGLGPVMLVGSAVVGALGVRKTMKAEGEFGPESKKQAGYVAGGLGGGMAGAAAGAALGSVVPVVGTGVGAIVGGIVGSMGGGSIGSKLGGLF